MRVLILALLLAAFAPLANAQVTTESGRKVTHGFFVIGPDTLGLRPWTSRWLAERLETPQTDSLMAVWPWDRLLLTLLDTHGLDDVPERPPAGPSVALIEGAAVWYPWDLRREMSTHEQRDLHRMAGLTSLVQVIVEFDRGGYRLRVRDVTLRGDRRVLVRYSVRASTLRQASLEVANRIARDWERTVRKGTR